MDHDYDETYQTIVSRRYGRSRLGYYFGPLFIFMGIICIAFTLADMYHGVYNKNKGETTDNNVYTWDENPFWPSYGKGFWTGLIFIATGIVGIISSCDHSLVSVYAFSILSAVSSVLGFYLLISGIIPVDTLTGLGYSTLGAGQKNTLGLNAVLMAMGAISFITGTFTGIVSALLAGCCTEKRGYGSQFIYGRKYDVLQTLYRSAYNQPQ